MVTDKKRLFEKHKKEMNVRMNRMMNMTSCVIEKSVNRVLIGKTFWKSMVLPSVLYASSVMDFNRRDEIDKMQVYENSVMRRMLRARSYSPICALRGEVGASLMRTRIMKDRLNYEDSLCCERNLLLREIYVEISGRKSGWSVVTRGYRKEVGLSEKRESVGREVISEKVRKWDSEKWRSELECKSSLEIYRMSKKVFGDENVYDNRRESVLWCEARLNVMKLECRNRFIGEDTTCKLCGSGDEDLIHFMLICSSLNEERAQIQHLQRPHQENAKEVIDSFLFTSGQLEQKKKSLWQLYCSRERKLRRREVE